MKPLLWILSAVSLGGCAVSAVMVFTGALDEVSFKNTFLVCSILWFATSSARIYLPAKR